MTRYLSVILLGVAMSRLPVFFWVMVLSLLFAFSCGEKDATDNDTDTGVDNDQPVADNFPADGDDLLPDDMQPDDIQPDDTPVALSLTNLWTTYWGLESTPQDRGMAVAIDATGNLFVAGENTEMSFPEDENFTTDGPFFLTKLASDGTIVWSVLSDAIGWVHQGSFLAVDADGNCFVVSSDNSQIHVTKFDGDGGTSWSSSFGSDAKDYANAIALDSAGDSYITGLTRGALYGNTYGGGNDAFLMKIDADGALVWAKQWSDDKQNQAHAVTLDGNGNIYVVGRTEDNADPDGGGDREHAFLVKFDTQGNRLWSKNWGVPEHWGIGYAVAVDTAGNIFAAGITSGAFEGNTSAGDADIFVTMFDADGTLLWTRQFGTDAWDQTYTIALDGKGHVFTAGTASNSAYCIETGCDYSFLFAAYDYAGNLIYFNEWGGGQYNEINSIAAGMDGDLFLTGHATEDMVDPDPAQIGEVFLSRFSVQ